MSEPAHVVQVERVGGVARPGDVGARPVRRLLQVVRRWMQRDRTSGATSLHGEIELCCPQLEVIPPLRLGIKAERNRRQQIATWSSVGQIKNVLCGKQALVRVRGIARLINVIAERKVGRQPTGEVWADRRVRTDFP